MPAQPPQPMIPNAAEDPFGAMNAMAQMRSVQRAPEIIIVNDGKPVEDVGAGKKGARIAKMVVPAVVALVLGVAVGQMAKNGAHYNEGITGAADILTVVKTSKKGLGDINKALDELSKGNFAPTKELTADVMKLAAKIDVKEEAVFRYKQNALDSSISGRTMAFFSGLAELKNMIDAHTKTAQNDDLGLGVAKANIDKAAMPANENAALSSMGATRYGVLLNNPSADESKNSGGSLGASFVELGKPVCSDDKIGDTGSCSDGISGFLYRNDAGGQWAKGKMAKANPGENVAPKSILLLSKNGTLDEIIKGSPNSAAVTMYTLRLQAIKKRAELLLEAGNKLEADLTKKAGESKKFTFFL
jgi:hypothetical protein